MMSDMACYVRDAWLLKAVEATAAVGLYGKKNEGQALSRATQNSACKLEERSTYLECCRIKPALCRKDSRGSTARGQ